MTLHDLDHYGLSADRGYLSQHEIDGIVLPEIFDAIEDAAAMLPALIATGRVRRLLQALPIPDLATFLDNAGAEQVNVAMLRYAFLVQAHVWGEPDPPASLPANLAVPYVALCDAAGLPPVMNYANYILDNWFRLDKAGGITLDNIVMDQHMGGGVDECWFVIVHVAIEAAAGRALQLGVDLVRASDAGDADRVEALLTEMHEVWDRINTLFDRMSPGCDPYIYFNRIRPYINGWKNNAALPEGLIYEGVSAFAGRPQQLRGPTGSQSSIVPTMDALYQVEHAQDELRDYLAELHAYRPRRHRAFIDDMAAASGLRDFAKGQRQPVKDAFNACVEQVARFRTRHLEYAASYINKQSGDAGNDAEVGTGGTPFMKYLKKHRDANRAQTI